MEKTIGKYEVVREIGRGGMAIVYKAIDPETKRTVALKVLLPSMVSRSTAERFNREAQAMAKLKHPNIVAVHDFGVTKGEHYFAMDFVEGESLKSIVKYKGYLSIRQFLDIAIQTAQALAYAHSEGMVHRDIKPGNIMVTSEGKVKVMDFGLVQIPGVTRVTQEGSAVGTAEYMSPEQISGQEIDSRTDIYSLGITMYEMLTGRSPFEAENFQAVLMKHKYETPKPIIKLRPEVPAELERIVMKAVSKDVSARYQTVQELLDELNRFKDIKRTFERESPAEEPSYASSKRLEREPPFFSPKTIEESERNAPSEKKTPKFGIEAEGSAEEAKRKILILVIGIVIVGALLCFGFLIKAKISSRTPMVSPELRSSDETETSVQMLEMADGHHNLGLRFLKEGLINEAIAEFEDAKRLRPGYGLYYKDLAVAYEQKGDTNKAIGTWQDLLRYDQSSSYTEMAREHIEKLKTQR